MEVNLKLNDDGRLWWCNTHSRRATHLSFHDRGDKQWHRCCRGSGIMIPCVVIDLTDILEIDDGHTQVGKKRSGSVD